MLTPFDYGKEPLYNKNTRHLMEKISFKHGGKEYDEKYPDGIPTSITLTLKDGTHLSTDIVMYPPGHARNSTSDLAGILQYKFSIMGRMALEQAELDSVLARLEKIETMSSADLQSIYNCQIKYAPESLD